MLRLEFIKAFTLCYYSANSAVDTTYLTLNYEINIAILYCTAEVIGDPHIITLDGFKYTFNGKGEFLLIDHMDGRFTLQGRMIDVPTVTSFSSNIATVFSAVV